MIKEKAVYLQKMKSDNFGEEVGKVNNSGDPFIVRGGYNCRHQWSFVNPDWYDETET